MSHFLKICAASALLAAASFGARAADAPVDPVTTAGDAQVVVRDAATGRLRAPTAGEFETLHAEGAKLRHVARPPLEKFHRSGAHGARLTDEFMSYSVMIKQPDGRLVEYCFEGPEAAEAAMAAPAAPVNTLPTE